MKEIWLNKTIRNKDFVGNNYYQPSNKYKVDKLFNKLQSYSRRNNYIYGVYTGTEENPEISYHDSHLFNKNMLDAFVDFCYKNK